jgi:hypothetical protein
MSNTHYRKAFKSPYLSSADIVEPTTLTIHHAYLEPDKTKKSKDVFNTAYFSQKDLRPGEPLKPMILNACNSKMMKDLTGSPYLEDWEDTTVQIYVDPSVKFGRETVEGLRIRKAPAQIPPATEAQLLAIANLEVSAAQGEWLLKNHPLNEKQASAFIEKVTV